MTQIDAAFQHRLGSFTLDINLSGGGDLLVLFGHSGSGKSLTLRALAGLLRPDRGRICFDRRPVFDSTQRWHMPPQQREAGLVLQSYALFPHMTVRENVAFGLHRWERRARARRVQDLMEMLGIADLDNRRPDQISGGQAQRVALARALAPRPRLLLLDEPFSALDSAIRVDLRRELARLQREMGLTVLFVTHDLREAYNLADRIAVFDRGRVLQTGSREEVFHRPATPRVAELTEVRNIWRCTVEPAEGGAQARVDGFTLPLTGRDYLPGPATVCVRPERVLLGRIERPDAAGVLAEIADEVAHGAAHTIFFRVPGAPAELRVEVDIASHPYEVMRVAQQRRWRLIFPPDAVHVMRADER